jgi:hypothetical protein
MDGNYTSGILLQTSRGLSDVNDAKRIKGYRTTGILHVARAIFFCQNAMSSCVIKPVFGMKYFCCSVYL